jgi:type III pantothenate kinase
VSRTLLIDVSNSFTKLAFGREGRLGRVTRLPTHALRASTLRAAAGKQKPDHVVFCSVVPVRNREILAAFPRALAVSPRLDLGVGIDYPDPAAIGADRLANAAACAILHGFPSIVVDFGTAVTFDVLSKKGDYIGGVIAPGLNAMTGYLHEKTALLPQVSLREPKSAVGRSTRDAMLSGAVHGYRGLVREILARITDEEFSGQKPTVVATGGDAALIAKGLELFDVVDPLLTLRGLLLIAEKNPPLSRSSQGAV